MSTSPTRPAAQELADAFCAESLHRLLDRLATLYCPVIAKFGATYHWSIMQAEYATDIVFGRRDDLAPLYDALVHTAIHAVKPDDVATFLGRKLHPDYQAEVGNDFHTRIEGTRIKHHMGPVSLKLYDKFGLILRIETTTNDVSFFSHYRTVEHNDGTTQSKFAPMRKTLHSLAPLREVCAASNRRYLGFLRQDGSHGRHEEGPTDCRAGAPERPHLPRLQPLRRRRPGLCGARCGARSL